MIIFLAIFYIFCLRFYDSYDINQTSCNPRVDQLPKVQLQCVNKGNGVHAERERERLQARMNCYKSPSYLPYT